MKIQYEVGDFVELQSRAGVYKVFAVHKLGVTIITQAGETEFFGCRQIKPTARTFAKATYVGTVTLRPPVHEYTPPLRMRRATR